MMILGVVIVVLLQTVAGLVSALLSISRLTLTGQNFDCCFVVSLYYVVRDTFLLRVPLSTINEARSMFIF